MKTLKSIGVVPAGMVLVFALSSLTDALFEKNNLLKISFTENPAWPVGSVLPYRCVYVTAGSFLTAAPAPHSSRRHAWVYAGTGFVPGMSGTVIL